MWRAAVLSLSLSGCVTLGQVTERVAGVNDQAVEVAETAMCRGITIGAWMRRYGSKKELAKAWSVLCSQNEFTPEVSE